MQLEKIFFKYTIRSFGLLAGIFFPILYLSDFLFSESFMPLYALIKLPFRYGQSLATLLLWSIWMAVRTMRKRYSDAAFITMGFRAKDAWRLILMFFAIFGTIDCFFIIPSNKWFFDEQLVKTNWSINYQKSKTENDPFFLNKLEDKVEVWHIKPKVYFKEGNIVKANNQEIACIKMDDNTEWIFHIQEKDFFVLWNEPKKLSWSGMKRAQAYLEYHGLDTLDVKSQWHIFASRVALIFSMLLCGFALGWSNGVQAMIICSVFSNWLNQIVIFMPLGWAIFCVWGNVILWIGLGLRWLL